jgi:hypothetical protein
MSKCRQEGSTGLPQHSRRPVCSTRQPSGRPSHLLQTSLWCPTNLASRYSGHSPRPVASKGTLPPCARIVALNLETTTIGKPNPTPSVHSEQTPSVQPRLTPPNLDPDEQANLQPTKQAVCVASLLDYQAGTKDSVPIMETISSKRIVKDGVPVTEMIPSKRIIIAVRSIEPIIGCQTISVASELELLQVLDLCLRTADPDILVGHNILQFNIPVLRASVRRLGANFTMALGRAGEPFWLSCPRGS